MERYAVPAAPPKNPRPPARRPRWNRIALELDGRMRPNYRHEFSQLLLDSYSEIRAFEHHYWIGSDMCPTYAARVVSAVNQDSPVSLAREGISGLEFDTKGVYLASVTKSGCLSVHDFESLYCSTYGPSTRSWEDDGNHLLHLSTSQSLDVVQWNSSNQDEVACASRQNDKVLLFDIGYISNEPVEVLEKGKSNLSQHNCGLHSGLSDIAFSSSEKSRLIASGLDGSIYIWDRRLGSFPCLELTQSQSQLNCLKLDIEGRIVFGASNHGIIYAWDLRGGRSSLAFQSHNEVYYPLLASLKVSTLLEQITSLKAQANILTREIFSISFDPSCAYQLAFHLSDGWSGVLNVSSFSVTHVHCPPPAWLDGVDSSNSHSIIRKPSWLQTSSIYAVGSASSNGIYLLDFYPDRSSACHVDFEEDLLDGASQEYGSRPVHNRYIPLSERVSVCAAHPINSTIIAGTKKPERDPVVTETRNLGGTNNGYLTKILSLVHMYNHYKTTQDEEMEKLESLEKYYQCS